MRDVLDALEDDAQAAIDNQIDRLNLLSDNVPHLPFPHSSQVEGEFPLCQARVRQRPLLDY